MVEIKKAEPRNMAVTAIIWGGLVVLMVLSFVYNVGM